MWLWGLAGAGSCFGLVVVWGQDGVDQKEQQKAWIHAGWVGPAGSPIHFLFVISTVMSGLGDSGHQHDQQDHEQQDERHQLRRSGDLENLGRGFWLNKYFDCFLYIFRDKLVHKVPGNRELTMVPQFPTKKKTFVQGRVVPG